MYLAIFGNNFQYTYVWKHSGIEQATIFKISALWEGQEGSFLLWIFWNSIFVLWFSFNKRFGKVLLFLLPINAFLISMILGVKLGGIEVGSSPFSLLKDSVQSDVYRVNPNFIPTDGQGMNALLQNYWMAIHPPVIFLGFSLAAIPFCLCLAGLYYQIAPKEWVKQCMPWLFTSVGLIALGMFMGAYWAYETLNFGGFWNWDPVENAIFIPWIVTLGAAHLGLIFLRKEIAYKAFVLSVLASFVLIIYSTFLTRSGILGDSSVHAFTDSGLSVQLLCFLFGTILVSVVVFVKTFKPINTKKSASLVTNGYDVWLIIGVIFLFSSALHVFLPTSFPVFNSVANWFGFPLKLATPGDQVTFYSNFQIWILFAVTIVLVIAQFRYFKKFVGKKSITELLYLPVLVTTIVGLAIYFYLDFEFVRHVKYFVFLLVCLLAFFVLFQLFFSSKLNLKKLSSATSHLGLVLFFIGVLISQGFTKILTHNQHFSGDLNKWGNILLVRNKTMNLGDYKVTYKGSYLKTATDHKIDKRKLSPTFKPNVVVTKSKIELGDVTIEAGEKLTLDAQNTFYQIKFESDKHSFEINPRVQSNDQMGVISSPDIDFHWDGDVYTHVSNFPDPEKSKPDWSKANAIRLHYNDVVFLGNKVLKVKSIENFSSAEKLETLATVEISTADTIFQVQTSLIKTTEGLQVIPAEVPELGLNMVMSDANKEAGEIGLYTLSQPQDWITIKSLFFPFMYLVWIGGIAMIVGSFMAVLAWAKVPSINFNQYLLFKINYKTAIKLVFSLSK